MPKNSNGKKFNAKPASDCKKPTDGECGRYAFCIGCSKAPKKMKRK
ncbi:MAG: hypothetical protein WAV31_01410 [Candidatus Moraniibacteriota bacterium]